MKRHRFEMKDIHGNVSHYLLKTKSVEFDTKNKTVTYDGLIEGQIVLHNIVSVEYQGQVEHYEQGRFYV